jgi:hypothetical protein
MKYTLEMGSGAMLYISSFIKTGSFFIHSFINGSTALCWALVSS